MSNVPRSTNRLEAAHQDFLRRFLPWLPGLHGPEVLVTMISLVLNAQLHVEQVISSEERGREKEIHLRQGHRWDRYDRQVGL